MAGLIMLAARWIIAAVFLRSGLGKAAGLGEFRTAVANYKLLPAALVAPVALTLPFAEVAAGLLLAIGAIPVIISAVLALLLVVFAAAIAVNLARGRVFDCGCAGSVAPRQISWQQVVADLVLAGVAAAVAVAPPAAVNLWRGPAGLVQVSTPAGGAFPLLLAVLLCVVMGAVLRRFTAIARHAAAIETGSSHH